MERKVCPTFVSEYILRTYTISIRIFPPADFGGPLEEETGPDDGYPDDPLLLCTDPPRPLPHTPDTPTENSIRWLGHANAGVIERPGEPPQEWMVCYSVLARVAGQKEIERAPLRGSGVLAKLPEALEDLHLHLEKVTALHHTELIALRRELAIEMETSRAPI